LVGNKTDVLHVNPNKREVPKEAAEKFARDNNLIFVGESSALSNQNIKEVMDALLERKIKWCVMALYRDIFGAV